MNRRHFMRSLAAIGAIPALPALPAAAPAPVVATKMQMLWATYYANMNNACSVAQIQSALNVSPAVSRSIHRELLARGVLVPDVTGRTVARRPMQAAPPRRHGVTRAARWSVADARRVMRAVTRDIPHQLPFPAKAAFAAA